VRTWFKSAFDLGIRAEQCTPNVSGRGAVLGLTPVQTKIAAI